MFYLMICVAYLLWLRFVMSSVLINSLDRNYVHQITVRYRTKELLVGGFKPKYSFSQ